MVLLNAQDLYVKISHQDDLVIHKGQLWQQLIKVLIKSIITRPRGRCIAPIVICFSLVCCNVSFISWASPRPFKNLKYDIIFDQKTNPTTSSIIPTFISEIVSFYENCRSQTGSSQSFRDN